jgi:hypothetical protein
MPYRRWVLTVLFSVVITFLLACGGGGSTINVQNPSAPASTSVSIAFQPTPAGSIIPNSTMNVTAVVTNDPSNAGVDWALPCPTGSNCGTILPLHTQSGAPTIYTAPPSVSGAGQSFTVEAFAAADHTKNVAATLSVIGFAGSIKGNYVFETQGVDTNGGPFQLAGVVALDGNGNVTGGEQTHTDFVQAFSDVITGGSYTVGPDGRGTLTINTGDQNIGQAGIENFAIVYVSNAKLFLITLDNPNLQPSNETSSGSMDLQTNTATTTGGYAFVVNGTDLSLNPMAMGGVMNIGSSNMIQKTGSVIDQDLAGTLIKRASLSGTTTIPDAFGSLHFTLTAPALSPTNLVFTGYIVDATHIKLIESDNSNGTGVGATGGIAISQGTATGTFNDSSFSGNFVFGILGQDLTGSITSLSCAGTLTADGAGKVTSGFMDEYFAGFGVAISDSLTGTYKLDSTQSGRADAAIKFTNNGPGPEFIFYLTGNGNPPLVLDADSNIGSVGVGISYPQSSSPISFNGPYGLYFTQNEFSIESDASAEIAVNGSAQTLSGTVDTNYLLSSQPDTNLTGTFGTIPSNGRVPGTLTNTFFQAGGNTPNTIATAYYLIDSGNGFVVETDSATTGLLLFGYFSQRTPLCQQCP